MLRAGRVRLGRLHGRRYLHDAADRDRDGASRVRRPRDVGRRRGAHRRGGRGGPGRRAETGGQSSPPVALDGVVYVGSTTAPSQTGGDFFAIDAATGATRWRIAARTDGDGWGPAAVAGGLVFACDRHGLHAFDAATGEARWQAQAPKGSAPAVADGVVYVGGASLLAFDAATGAQRWNFLPQDTPSGAAGYLSTPAVADGVVYAGTGTHRLYAVDAATGQERWEVTFLPVQESGDIAPLSAPVVADGRVYAVVHARPSAGVLKAFLWAIDAATGHKLWATETLGSSLGVGATQPAVAGGAIYVQGPDAAHPNRSIVVALDAATGTERWRVNVPVTGSFNGSEWSGPSVVGDTVLVTGAHVLEARDAAGGRLRWRVATSQFQPTAVAASGGMLFVGGSSAFVDAFGTG